MDSQCALLHRAWESLRGDSAELAAFLLATAADVFAVKFETYADLGLFQRSSLLQYCLSLFCAQFFVCAYSRSPAGAASSPLCACATRFPVFVAAVLDSVSTAAVHALLHPIFRQLADSMAAVSFDNGAKVAEISAQLDALLALPPARQALVALLMLDSSALAGLRPPKALDIERRGFAKSLFRAPSHCVLKSRCCRYFAGGPPIGSSFDPAKLPAALPSTSDLAAQGRMWALALQSLHGVFKTQVWCAACCVRRNIQAHHDTL
jgi:hypothetical protein